MINVGEDYRFRDEMFNPDSKDTIPIEILTEPYKGVILRYTRVGVKELENGTALLQFEYDMIDAGQHTETKLRKDERFHKHLGILLNHMILESLEGREDNADRENYSEEPNAERTVHTESSAVSKG